MESKFLNTLIFCAIAVLSTVPLACSDKDDDITSEDLPTDEHILTQEEINKWAADNIILWLCDAQTDSLTGKITSQTPDYGEVLNSGTPTVRYTKAATFEDARKAFQAWIIPDATQDPKQDGGITVDMGSEGTVTFRPETGDGKVAVADIQMTRLPDITQVVFIKPEAWPENNNIGIVKGSTWLKDGKLYVCVRTCDDGIGYLVHFRTECGNDKNSLKSGHTYANPKNKVYYTGCYDLHRMDHENYMKGGTDVVDAVRTYLYKLSSGQWVCDDTSAKTIKYIGLFQTGDSTKLHNKLYASQSFFYHGNWKGDVDGISGAEGTRYHFIRYPYCRMTKDTVTEGDMHYDCWNPGAATHDLKLAYGDYWSYYCQNDWEKLMDLDVIKYDTDNSIVGLGIKKKKF